MIKFRLYYDADRGTAWLNEMAAKGYSMTRFFAGFFTFEPCEPGEYLYQIDFSSKLFSVPEDYREFMEETGVEVIQPWGPWIFLRKKASEGNFQLYSDVDSQIKYYTKIRNMFKIVTLLELICFVIECICVGQVRPADRPLFIFFVLLIGTFIVVFIRMAFRTNKIIAKLKERKGETVSLKNQGPSPSLLAGLLLNGCSCALLNPDLSAIRTIVQIIAIILMMVGIIQTSSHMAIQKEMDE